MRAFERLKESCFVCVLVCVFVCVSKSGGKSLAHLGSLALVTEDNVSTETYREGGRDSERETVCLYRDMREDGREGERERDCVCVPRDTGRQGERVCVRVPKHREKEGDKEGESESGGKHLAHLGSLALVTEDNVEQRPHLLERLQEGRHLPCAFGFSIWGVGSYTIVSGCKVVYDSSIIMGEL